MASLNPDPSTPGKYWYPELDRMVRNRVGIEDRVEAYNRAITKGRSLGDTEFISYLSGILPNLYGARVVLDSSGNVVRIASAASASASDGDVWMYVIGVGAAVGLVAAIYFMRK